MLRHRHLLLCAALAAASFSANACYTVYDRSDRVVYQSALPPVDMSRPLHETVPARFPGGHMIFDTGNECPVINSIAARKGARDMTSQSPLFTDERTAVAMRMPHITLAGGIALVQARDAALAPGLTIIAAAPVTASGPNTAVMGAGPRRGAVITELRDPPVTIEQYGGRVFTR